MTTGSVTQKSLDARKPQWSMAEIMECLCRALGMLVVASSGSRTLRPDV